MKQMSMVLAALLSMTGACNEAADISTESVVTSDVEDFPVRDFNDEASSNIQLTASTDTGNVVANDQQIDRRQKFTVPADPSVTYYVIGEVEVLPSGMTVITTERDSPRGGKSYAIREVDCASMRARYIGDADKLSKARADAQARRYVGEFGPLVGGSSTDTVARLACKLAGR